jgi:hypothetical protein
MIRVTVYQGTNVSSIQLPMGSTLGYAKTCISGFNAAQHRLAVAGTVQSDSYVLKQDDTIEVLASKTAGAR